MAAKRDDVTVMGADGFTFPELMDDETTPIGVLVELRGAAATMASHECILSMGSTSIALTTAAASGEVTASVTAANLVTLGATIGSVVTARWEGTITDGANTHRWRYQMDLTVEDRLFRWPVLLTELAIDLPEIGKSCTLPSGQSNWWPQCRKAMRELRNRIDRQQGGVKAFLLTHPDDVRDIGELACLAKISEVMYGNQRQPGSSLASAWQVYTSRLEAAWADVLARVKADSAGWSEQSTSHTLHIKPVAMMSGLGGNGGGGIL